MHVFAPQTRGSTLSIFFNVDTSVGEKGANTSPEDVLLVQFLLHKIGEGGVGGGITQDRKARLLRVVPTGTCDPLTIDGIRAVQEAAREQRPSTIVDGRVSVARGYSYGRGDWTIVTLNASVRAHYPRIWPRLQDFPDCPAPLRARVQVVL
jgi:hypothetical protein